MRLTHLHHVREFRVYKSDAVFQMSLPHSAQVFPGIWTLA